MKITNLFGIERVQGFLPRSRAIEMGIIPAEVTQGDAGGKLPGAGGSEIFSSPLKPPRSYRRKNKAPDIISPITSDEVPDEMDRKKAQVLLEYLWCTLWKWAVKGKYGYGSRSAVISLTKRLRGLQVNPFRHGIPNRWMGEEWDRIKA